MIKTKSWPTRFSVEQLDRMDAQAAKMGLNRTDVIRLALSCFLDWFEERGHELNKRDFDGYVQEMLARLDNRTKASVQNGVTVEPLPHAADAPNASAEKIRPAVVVYGKGKVLRKRPGGAGPTNPPGDQPK